MGLTMLILLMSGLLLTAVIHDGCGQPQSLTPSGPLPLDAFQTTDDSSNGLTSSQTQANFLRWLRRPLNDLSAIERQLNANNDEGLPPSADETIQKKWSGILNSPRTSEIADIFLPDFLKELDLKERLSGMHSSEEQPSDKDKRDNYLSMCHFKICNLGRKRRVTSQHGGSPLSWSPLQHQ